MMRRLAFASCYVYSPDGTGQVCERSRLLRSMLKEGNQRFLHKYAARVHEQTHCGSALRGFFGKDDLLVPVPGSAASGAGRAWVAADLARALVEEGLGCATWPLLLRLYAVNKSATAHSSSRPSVKSHYESFGIAMPAEPPRSIVLVDDVITRGRTLLAAAARIEASFPETQVRGFAVLRTSKRSVVIKHLLEPCLGEIWWRAEDAHRRP